LTRQEAIDQILAIVDQARPPAQPAIAAPTLATDPEKKGARRQARGRTSSSSASAGDAGSADQDLGSSAALPSARAPSRPPASSAEFPAPSQMGGAAEATASGKGGADAEALEQLHKEQEIKRAALNGELAHLPMTDLGNVERFRKRFGDSFKWTPALGWLYWDGKRWARKGAEGKVRIAAHETVRAIQDEAKSLFEQAATIAAEFETDELEQAEDEAEEKKKGKSKPRLRVVDEEYEAEIKAKKKKKKLSKKKLELFDKYLHLRGLGSKLIKWGKDSEMNAKIVPIDKNSAPYLAVEIEAFDADPWKFNLNNGTLVFDREAKTITIKPHDPADLITKISPVDFDPRASCDVFDGFLERIQPDVDNRRFVIEWLGYSLTGDASEQQLAVFYGQGGNGKGVLIRIVSHIAGDYAKATPIETFLAEASPRNASAPTPERAALPGVRLLTASEPEKNARLDEGFIKLVTGNDMISARDLNKSQFEFMPEFKLTISANHQPKVNDRTEGIWRRMNVVPFEVNIPRAEWDLKLDAKLRAEASGVLNVLLDGLRGWFVTGLVRSEASQKATAKYREANDPLGRFLADCVVAETGSRVQSTVLHELYIAWARATGAPEWKNAGFTNAMTERGFDTKKSNVMFFIDIKATKLVSDFTDYSGKPVTPDADARGRKSDPRDDDDEIAF
jgi:putative DNA primase/helicase